MRKEYSLVTFADDALSAIDDFFSNFTSLYTLYYTSSDVRVYRNLTYNVYLTFYNYENSRIALFCSTAYDTGKQPWYQDDVVCSGYSTCTTDIINSSSVVSHAYYFPAPTLFSGDVMIANYNSNNNTFMFTIKDNMYNDYSFSSIRNKVTRSSSIIIGETEKYIDTEGGFFYGGDFMCSYEVSYYRRYTQSGYQDGYRGVFCLYDSIFNDAEFHKKPRPINHSGYWSSPWINNPYTDFDCACRNTNHSPNPDNVNRLDVIMLINVDNAPNRRKYELVNPNYSELGIPEVKRRGIWAITMEIDYYVRLICSITASKELVPRYEPLNSHDTIERGHFNNTLNNISVIMPLWFMIRRDPQYLNNYSAFGRNNVINFVNMYDMDADRMENGTFPTREHEYDCFQMGSRRSMYGMKGYAGLAFMQEEE